MIITAPSCSAALMSSSTTRASEIAVARTINRFGLEFVENKTTSTYLGSGLRFASYYKKACKRCGWSFAGSRWKKHNNTECDKVLAQCAADGRVASHAASNLFGERRDHR